MVRMIVFIYLAVINLIAFIVYGRDKHYARTGQYRVREWVLFFLAFIGGSAGALIGMHAFHHKTRKAYFAIGIPLILIAQIALVVYLLWKGIL